jgi:hypothetical protein
LSIISNLFEQLLSRDDLPLDFDYVETVKDSLEHMIEETTGKLAKIQAQIDKLEKLKNKFHRKNKKGKPKNETEPNNFFKSAIQYKIDNFKTQYKNGEELNVNVNRALEIIDDYEFEVEKRPEATYDDMATSFRYMFSNIHTKPFFKKDGS